MRARSPTNYLSSHRSIGGATVVTQRRRANASPFRAVRSRQQPCRSRLRVFPPATAVTLAIVPVEVLEALVGPISMIASSRRTSKANVASEQWLRQGKRRGHRAFLSPRRRRSSARAQRASRPKLARAHLFGREFSPRTLASLGRAARPLAALRTFRQSGRRDGNVCDV